VCIRSARTACAAAVLLAFVVVPCSSRTIHVEPPPDHTSRDASLSLSMAEAARGECPCDSTVVDSTLYRLDIPGHVYSFGDTVRFEYRVTNQGEVERVYEFSTSCQDWYAVVPEGNCGPLDPGCDLAWEPPWGCLQSPTWFTLAPGETETFRFDWRLHGIDGDPVAPGAYTVYAAMRNDYPGTLLSVPIEVVPYGPRVIQEALDIAVEGDSIVVAPGTYAENLVLDDTHRGITLVSSAGPDATVIDGGGRGSVVYFRNVNESTILEGFTIRNGRNESTAEFWTYVGGGIALIQSARPTIRGNVIRDNRSDYGAGLSAGHACGALITENLFLDNEASWRGGGVHIWLPGYNPGALVTGNTFVGNRAVNGAGVYARTPYGGDLTVVSNNIFHRNQSEGAGGGLYCHNGSSSVRDLCNAYWENVPDDMTSSCQTYDPVLADPRFCDPDAGDYRLQAGSPCSAAENPECGRIGAYDVSCPMIGVPVAAPSVAGVRLEPNPFRASIRIQVDGAEHADARVDVYSAAGRRVFSVPLAGATHWDGHDHTGRPVAAGTYFVRVHVDGVELATRKVVRLPE